MAEKKVKSQTWSGVNKIWNHAQRPASLESAKIALGFYTELYPQFRPGDRKQQAGNINRHRAMHCGIKEQMWQQIEAKHAAS
ncbi:MAG: hypothetical protein MMC23_005002 [Stictis urceolatum]|nr:hypothetical protein [Stictis urceolata]